MNKKIVIIFLALVFTFAFTAILGAETKVIPMPDLLKPETIFFTESRMYVTEKTTVYIYSLKDHKLINKFGKKGAGPAEFMVDYRLLGLFISKQGRDLMIHSFGKVSWFTRDGVYKREMKMPNPVILFVQALGDNIIGRRIVNTEVRWQVLTLFDPKFNKIKEIFRAKHLAQPGKGTDTLNFTPPASVYDNKLFVVPDNNFTIDVYDQDGKKLYSINREEKRRPVTAADKKKIVHFYETSPLTKDGIQFLRPLRFPGYFHAIRGLVAAEDKIFVVTNHENEAGYLECIVLDLEGKLLKRTHVPLKATGPLELSPFSIHNSSFYQLKEDDEGEEWTLNITPVL
ncbi:MAG: hypothetical protein GY940_24655 [bacterium]|nr:hypothetical protein [bacterium]